MALKNSDGRVAVIIPCYNAQKTVQDTIESVLNQTFSSFVIYVVNDGSTDNTSAVLDRLQQEYPEKIIVINQDNQGQAKARNVGIQESAQQYIAFLDSDDIWHPEKLERQVKVLDSDMNVGMCYTSALKIDENSNKIGRIDVNPEYRGKCFKNLIISNNIVASSVMVRRSALGQTGVFDSSLGACENWDLWLRISRKFSIEFLDIPLTSYRIHHDNMTKNCDKMYSNRHKVLEKHFSGSSCNNEISSLKSEAMHRHYKLFGLRLVEELRLSEARKQFYNALRFKIFDFQLYKLILKTFLGKNIFLLARKIKGS